MGGKSYYCDYCCCFLKNDKSIRKVHNEGLSHKIKKHNFMQRYKDPQQILIEEQAKEQCSRFFKGQCKFDFYCQYSHYNSQQIKELQEIVGKRHDSDAKQSKDYKVSKNQRSIRLRLKKLKLKKLPPSLRPCTSETINFLPSEWG